MARYDRTLLVSRIEDAGREIGTLLMAFAPLDAEFVDPAVRGHSRPLLFMAWGAFFLSLVLLSELRRAREL